MSESAYPSIEDMVRELEAVGWKKIRGTLWQSPGRGYFRGPFGAWRVLQQWRVLKLCQ